MTKNKSKGKINSNDFKSVNTDLSKSLEIRTMELDVKSTENTKLTVEGYANITNSVSQLLCNDKGEVFLERIEQGVFGRALERADKVEFLDSHDRTKILSSTTNGSLRLKEDDKGLYIEADIVDTTVGRDAYELIRSGLVGGMSFGMTVLEEDWSMYEGYPLRTIKEIELYEVSMTRNPAYKASSITTRGEEVDPMVEIPEDLTTKEENGMDFEKLCEILLSIDESLKKMAEVEKVDAEDVELETEEREDTAKVKEAEAEVEAEAEAEAKEEEAEAEDESDKEAESTEEATDTQEESDESTKEEDEEEKREEPTEEDLERQAKIERLKLNLK